MKLVVILFLSLIIISPLAAQKQAKNPSRHNIQKYIDSYLFRAISFRNPIYDLDFLKKEKIKSIQTELVYYYPNNRTDKRLLRLYHLDSLGRITEQYYSDHGYNYQHKVNYKYNAQGNLIEEKLYQSANHRLDLEKHRLIVVPEARALPPEYYPPSEFFLHKLYEYYPNGILKSVAQLNRAGEKINEEQTVIEYYD